MYIKFLSELCIKSYSRADDTWFSDWLLSRSVRYSWSIYFPGDSFVKREKKYLLNFKQHYSLFLSLSPSLPPLSLTLSTFCQCHYKLLTKSKRHDETVSSQFVNLINCKIKIWRSVKQIFCWHPSNLLVISDADVPKFRLKFSQRWKNVFLVVLRWKYFKGHFFRSPVVSQSLRFPREGPFRRSDLVSLFCIKRLKYERSSGEKWISVKYQYAWEVSRMSCSRRSRERHNRNVLTWSFYIALDPYQGKR